MGSKENLTVERFIKNYSKQLGRVTQDAIKIAQKNKLPATNTLMKMIMELDETQSRIAIAISSAMKNMLK